MRHGDNQFADIVRWSQFAMIKAEEIGITKNIDEMLKSDNPTIKRMLGVTPGNAARPSASTTKWAYSIIKQVGNYGESFERNVGTGSLLKIARGQNALWTKGGLQYAPPIR